MSGLTMLDYKFIDDDNINELVKLMWEEKLPFPNSANKFNTLAAAYGRDKRAISSREGRVNLINQLMGHSAAREAKTGAGQNQENEVLQHGLATENVSDKNGLDQVRNGSGEATGSLPKSGWTASMESVEDSPPITSVAGRKTSCSVDQNASATQISSNTGNREAVDAGTVFTNDSGVKSSNGYVRRFTGAAARKTSCSTGQNVSPTQQKHSPMVSSTAENREILDVGTVFTNDSAAKSSNGYVPRFTGAAAREKMLKQNPHK